MSLKKNVIANYLGSGWQALLGLAFLPLYIHYLGVEAYGLIGIFTLLQAWLGLLDAGMRPALGREMARFTAGAHDAGAIRDLLRSVEAIVGIAGGFIALGIWAASRWLASDWIRTESLPVDVVATALAVMGVVVALRFVGEAYVSCLAGLQRQVLLNMVIGSVATVRALGALAVLAWISPTIEAFFLWEGLVSVSTVVILALTVHRVLPKGSRPARFSKPALLSIWRFAAGSTIITVLALLLTQVDKLVLSRLLTLKTFGYYALAGVVAGGLTTAVAPIAAAYYPRFTELVTLGDKAALRASYHQAAQLVTVVAGSAAAVLIAFAHPILLLWTGDAEITRQVAPLMMALVLGTLLNGLMWMPYQMQLAHGWTSLAAMVNVVAVVILVPAIVLIVPIYGAIGAAWIWVILNAGYVAFDIVLMHRRILRSEMWHWYFRDVAAPLGSIIILAALARWAMPEQLNVTGRLVWLAGSASLTLMAGTIFAPVLRAEIWKGFLSLRSRASWVMG